LTAVFLLAVVLGVALCARAVADCALTAAHLFFVAAMIALLPAAESLRLGLGAAFGVEG
jgi:hypothetical protein